MKKYNIDYTLATKDMVNEILSIETEYNEVYDKDSVLEYIDREQYVVALDKDNNKVVGVLRYNYFRDDIPFCNMLFVLPKYRNAGIGKTLVLTWEAALVKVCNDCIMTSVKSNEDTLKFFDKLKYTVCGSMINTDNTTEILLRKQYDYDTVSYVSTNYLRELAHRSAD